MLRIRAWLSITIIIITLSPPPSSPLPPWRDHLKVNFCSSYYELNIPVEECNETRTNIRLSICGLSSRHESVADWQNITLTTQELVYCSLAGLVLVNRPVSCPQIHLSELVGRFTNCLVYSFWGESFIRMGNTHTHKEVPYYLSNLDAHIDVLMDGWEKNGPP